MISIESGGIVERRFEKETKDCRTVNEKVLFEILKANAESEMGTKLGFKSIKSLEGFKKKVPLTEYKHYEECIKRMANGEKNVLTSDKVEYFGHTSGTTGKQKLIPSTRRGRRVASKYMALLVNKYAHDNFKESWKHGKGLMIADMVMITFTQGGIPICSATSGGMNGIRHVFPYLYTSPIEVMKIKDKEAALYLHLLFALKEVKLSYVSGVFISNVLDLFRILEARHEDLARDIRRGRICTSLNIDERSRKNLNKLLSPDAARADQLEREFRKGFKGMARRIWPNLTYIAAVTGANFSIYDDKVNHYTDSLPIYSPVYAATEAIIGINPRASSIQYVVVPDTAFYEFIPVKEGKEDMECTLCMDELKAGGTYEIVITNRAGLYRYRLGDVVKVVGFHNSCPEIAFLYRKNQVLNMVSEKTNEEHLTAAIRNTMKKLNLSLVDYTTMPDNSVTPGRYVFYLEFKSSMNVSEVELLEETLDREIRKSNLAYDRARSSKKLGRVKAVLLEPNTFNLMKESLFNKGVSKNQAKIPRVVAGNEQLLHIIKSNIMETKTYGYMWK